MPNDTFFAHYARNGLSVRWATEADAAAMLSIYAPFITDSPASFELEVPSTQTFAARITETMQTHPWLVCTRGDELLGYAYASPYRKRKAYQWSTESSVYIAENARRQGIGRYLYEVLFELLRQQGFCNVYAGMTLPNDGSQGIHKAFGFQHVGTYENVGYKMGEWHDVSWWVLALRTPPKQPTAPLDFAQLCELLP